MLSHHAALCMGILALPSQNQCGVFQCRYQRDTIGKLHWESVLWPNVWDCSCQTNRPLKVAIFISIACFVTIYSSEWKANLFLACMFILTEICLRSSWCIRATGTDLLWKCSKINIVDIVTNKSKRRLSNICQVIKFVEIIDKFVSRVITSERWTLFQLETKCLEVEAKCSRNMFGSTTFQVNCNIPWKDLFRRSPWWNV